MKVVRYSPLILFALLLVACGEPITEVEKAPKDSKEEKKNEKQERIKNMYYLIPSPIETMMLLQKAGAEYDSEILNSPLNSKHYETEFDKAVNLGVYTSDLSFSTMFDQSQETMFFLTTAKKMAEGLSIMKAFSPETLERIEANIDDKDSLMHLISDSYWVVDAYLKENENMTVSGLIIFGGWIEGLHIASQLAENDPENQEIRNRIVEQKYSLNNLILLIDEYQDEELKGVTDDLRTLQPLFNKATENVSGSTSTKVNENGITTIGGKKKLTLSEEQLQEIFALVHKIRSKYTNP